MATVEAPSVPAVVHAVTVKLPIFWPESADVWFLQAEAQFETKSITASKTKYQYCVAALSKDDAKQILDVLRAPGPNPYETLKRRLTQLHELNPFQRYEAFMSLTLAPDQKPSHLMNRMLALVPADYKVDFLFRGFFLSQLPSNIRSHLFNADFSDPRSLSEKADELWQLNSNHAVSALDVHQETEAVNALQRKDSRAVPRSRPSRQSSSQSPSSSSSAGRCFYHLRFGKKAHKCEAPCSWTPGN